MRLPVSFSHLLLVALLLLVAVPVLAQDLDLSVRIFADPREATLVANYGISVAWRGDVVPEGGVLIVETESPIGEISAWDNELQCTVETQRVRCTLPRVSSFDGGFHLVTRPASPGTYKATATISSATPDAHPANNIASASIEVAGLPFLRPGAVAVGSVRPDGLLDPEGIGTLRGSVQNDGMTATDVTLRITLPEGGSILALADYLGPHADCQALPAELVCHWPVLQRFELMQFQVTYVAPDRDDGGTVPVRMVVDAAQPDFDPASRTFTLDVPLRRRFKVTNGADEGFGSLRQAILDSRAQCQATPCLIAIRTSDPIQPGSPLPQIGGDVKIDGGEPRAILDGSLLMESHALDADICELEIVNLVIRNFQGHAIEAKRAAQCPPSSWSGHLIVRQTELAGNLRGVVTHDLRATIRDNTIRDHKRAGMFLNDTPRAEIEQNTITGNGASGIFVNPSASPAYYGGPSSVSITRNVIRDNQEWGVARTHNGLVAVTENSIVGNRLYAIDVDLDLDHPSVETPSHAPAAPVVVSATWDPVRGQTIVRLRVAPSTSGHDRIDVFASNSLSPGGYPQAEQFVAYRWPDGTGELEVPVDGDQRGKWITAMTLRTITYEWESILSDSSELSNALRVE